MRQLLLVTLLLPASLEAQQAPPAVPSQVTPLMQPPSASLSDYAPTPGDVPADMVSRSWSSDPFLVRSFSGGAGMVVGGLAGAVVGGALRKCSTCSTADLGGVFIGAVIGGMAGSAAGAAAVPMGDGCSYGGRLGRATAGSLAGTLLGGLIAAGTGSVVPAMILMPTGAAALSLGCRPRRE